MPFCGLKKNKSQKRDNSPPYASGIAGEVKDYKTRLENLNTHLAKAEEEVKQYKSKFLDEESKCKKFAEETTKLKTQLQDLKDKESEVVKTEVSNLTTSAIPDEFNSLKTKLENVESKFQEAEKLKQEFETKNKTLVEELQNAKKVVDETKQQAEVNVNKIEEELKQTKNKVENEITQRTKAEEEREKYKREKDSIENTLSHTSKELAIAKKESHIPRSPTRAPSDEWKAKIENAEAELERERNQRLEKEKENSRLNNDKELLEKEKGELKERVETLISGQKDELENLKKDLDMNHKNDIKRLEETVRDTAEAKEKLLTRLSSQTAAKVLDNNPNVADISDPNRPQKLAEQLSQVYDDQWTDATEALEQLSINEDEVVKTLLDLLTTIYTHCKEAAENQMSRIEEDLFLPPMESASAGSPDTNGEEGLKSPTSSKQSMSKIPRFTSHKGRPALPNITTEKKTVDNDSPGARGKDNSKRLNTSLKIKGEKLPEIPTEIRKGIKEYRKRVMKQVWPVLEKEILSKLRTSEEFNDKAIEACMPYIVKCVELCWYMRVQDPPVVLSWSVPSEREFNEGVYRAYLKSGTHVDYVVWPAMYLYEDGPTLSKGVAQGCNQ